MNHETDRVYFSSIYNMNPVLTVKFPRVKQNTKRNSFRYKTSLMYTTGWVHYNPNTLKSSKISQKLSPKHAACGVAQSPYPIYRHGKACLSKQPPWRAAGDLRLARGRARVRALTPVGALRVLFFSILPSFLLQEIIFSYLPHQTHESIRIMIVKH